MRDLPEGCRVTHVSVPDAVPQSIGDGERSGVVASSQPSAGLAVNRRRTDVIVADMDLGVGLRTVLRGVRARFPGVPVMMLDRAGDSARGNVPATWVWPRCCTPAEFAGTVDRSTVRCR